MEEYGVEEYSLSNSNPDMQIFFMLIAGGLSFVATRASILDRMVQYYWIFSICTIPNMIFSIEDDRKRTVWFLVISVFVMAYNVIYVAVKHQPHLLPRIACIVLQEVNQPVAAFVQRPALALRPGPRSDDVVTVHVQKRLHRTQRARSTAYISTPAATLALRLSSLPRMGTDTARSQLSSTRRPTPSPSAPMTSAIGPVRSREA